MIFAKSNPEPRIVAYMQPYFFPYIGYWQLIKSSTLFIVTDDCRYLKNGWINRNRLLMRGQPEYFTLRLEHANCHKRVDEIKIVSDPRNRCRVLGKIETAYSKAPYYRRRLPLIKELVSDPEPHLGRYVGRSIRRLALELGIKTEIVDSTSLLGPHDPAVLAQDWLLRVCSATGADIYLNAIGGQEFYDRKSFADIGVELKFIRNLAAPYRQFGDEFIPNLSILDLLMFCSDAEIAERLDACEFF